MIGFLGFGIVLEEATKICDELGLAYRHYEKLGDIDCDVLFALRQRKMIPVSVINNIPKGVIVIHYGKLPCYRGYYPINQALLHGEREVGITMFYIDEGIDTGDIIEQKTIGVKYDETVDEIYQRCNSVAIQMFKDNIEAIVSGTAKRMKQIGDGSVFTKDDLPEEAKSLSYRREE